MLLALWVNPLCYAYEINDSIHDCNNTTDSVPLTRRAKIKANIKKKGNIFYRFIKQFDEYDTTYVSPNYYNFTAMGQNTNYFQVYKLTGKNEEGRTQSISTKPAPSIKIGPYFGWRWIFLGYTFDASHPRSSGKSTEFNLSLYSAMLGCDFLYVKNTGDFKLRKAVGFDGVIPKSVSGTPFNGMDAKTISFSGYYVFNHHKFSYPAAYNQSTVQRKSCGSVMLGLGFSKQKINFDYTQLPAELIGNTRQDKIIDELKFNHLNYNYYYVSCGYAYNWVFAHNWLLGASIMPTIGLRKENDKRIKGEVVFDDIKNFSFDCVSRAGIVWNNTHWFAGASYISNLYLYRKKQFSLTNSVNFLNIYVGFFFNRKKQYK